MAFSTFFTEPLKDWSSKTWAQEKRNTEVSEDHISTAILLPRRNCVGFIRIKRDLWPEHYNAFIAEAGWMDKELLSTGKKSNFTCMTTIALWVLFNDVLFCPFKWLLDHNRITLTQWRAGLPCNISLKKGAKTWSLLTLLCQCLCAQGDHCDPVTESMWQDNLALGEALV